MPTHLQPILASRLRRIDGSFAFLPHRFLRDGFLQSLTDDELRLYLMLVLAADGARVQVLSLPPEPVATEPRPLTHRDQASACQAILASLGAAESK